MIAQSLGHQVSVQVTLRVSPKAMAAETTLLA